MEWRIKMMFIESEFKKIKNLIGKKIIEVDDYYPDDEYDDSFIISFDNGESLDIYEYKFWGHEE